MAQAGFVSFGDVCLGEIGVLACLLMDEEVGKILLEFEEGVVGYRLM